MNIKRAELPVVNVEANRLSFERSDPFISMFTGVKTQPFMSICTAILEREKVTK